MSQVSDLLALLSDRQPHEMRDIHRRIGFCRLNSRVSELRARGHRIECEKTGGRYVYQLLLSEPEVDKGPPVPATAFGSLSRLLDAPADEVAARGPIPSLTSGTAGASSSTQLSLDVQEAA